MVAGFSTHPHWDHLLWHARLGAAPRYGTARCAATVRDRLSDAGAKARVTRMMPPGIVDQVPLDLLGLVTGLPADTARIPWDGPGVRHRAYVHALRDTGVPDDPRLGPAATFGQEWLPGLHERQRQHLVRGRERDRTPG